MVLTGTVDHKVNTISLKTQELDLVSLDTITGVAQTTAMLWVVNLSGVVSLFLKHQASKKFLNSLYWIPSHVLPSLISVYVILKLRNKAILDISSDFTSETMTQIDQEVHGVLGLLAGVSEQAIAVQMEVSVLVSLCCCCCCCCYCSYCWEEGRKRCVWGGEGCNWSW